MLAIFIEESERAKRAFQSGVSAGDHYRHRRMGVGANPYFTDRDLIAPHNSPINFKCQRPIDRLPSAYLPQRTRASFRRSTVKAMPTPITRRASVAPKLPGAIQLTQVVMISGASYTVRPLFELASSIDGSPSARVNPLAFLAAKILKSSPRRAARDLTVEFGNR
jgi:hypothetical protein